MGKQPDDVTYQSVLEWDRFQKDPPKDSLPIIYAEVQAVSKKVRTWYWASIGSKRFWSTTARGFLFTFAARQALSADERLIERGWPLPLGPKRMQPVEATI